MSSDVNAHVSRFEPLPRGRHKLSPKVVLASQRDRILRAMLDCVAARGYSRTTVPEVVAAARVSRNAFYGFFSDKTACFLALCDDLSAGLIEDLFRQDTAPDWVGALRSGLEIYLRWWQERPAFSRTYLVELPFAGPRGVEQRERQYANFRGLFEQLAHRARREQPDLPPLSPLVPRLLVVATTELIAEEARAGPSDRLTELQDDLLFTMIKLLADDATAWTAVGRVRSP